MEVHHHSHTSRKKWTHYLWEFLMLFLAVFCGFLVVFQYYNRLENLHWLNTARIRFHKQMLRQAIALIGSIKQEYHLK